MPKPRRIVGAQLGYAVLDPLAAVVIAIIVLKLAYRTLTDALKGLGDAGLEPEVTDRIGRAIESVEGVIGIESIKARRIGQKLEVGIRVKVDSGRTVEWSNAVARSIRDSVRASTEGAGSIEIGFQGLRTEGAME